MIPQFAKLEIREQDLLIKAPALFSVLASCSNNMINKIQKADAIKLAHIKTFTAIPELQPYFKEAEKNFREDFEEIAAQYYPFDEKHRDMLKTEVRKVQQIIQKLEPHYASVLTKSLERYAGHVKRATHSIFRDFVFPLVLFDLKENK